MLGFLRLAVFGFLALSVVFVCLSFYSRAVRKGKLRAEWEEGARDVDEDTFVDQGLKEYEGSLRRKLIWGVYVVPMVGVCVIIYLTNFS